jgi:hypothetical protein
LIEIKKPSLSLCFPDDLSRRSDRIFCRSGLCCEELKMATHLRIVLLAAATAAGTLFGAQSAQAATAAARPHAIVADLMASTSNVLEVGRRGWRGGGWGYRRGWRGGGWGYRRGWRGGGWGYRRGWYGGGWGYRRGWGGWGYRRAWWPYRPYRRFYGGWGYPAYGYGYGCGPYGWGSPWGCPYYGYGYGAPAVTFSFGGW